MINNLSFSKMILMNLYILAAPQSTHASFPGTLFLIQCILKASVSVRFSPSLCCRLENICCSIAAIQLSRSSKLVASKCHVLFSNEMMENSKEPSDKKCYINNNVIAKNTLQHLIDNLFNEPWCDEVLEPFFPGTLTVTYCKRISFPLVSSI